MLINIIDKKINRIWKDWQGNVIDRFAQLNYGYSITVHKSQGSTFKNVFIDKIINYFATDIIAISKNVKNILVNKEKKQ